MCTHVHLQALGLAEWVTGNFSRARMVWRSACVKHALSGRAPGVLCDSLCSSLSQVRYVTNCKAASRFFNAELSGRAPGVLRDSLCSSLSQLRYVANCKAASQFFYAEPSGRAPGV